jgi:tetratricopeptide (TPR) repeat protein
MYRAELGLAYQDALFRYTAEANQLSESGQDPSAKRAQAESTFRLAETAILDAIDFVPPEYDNYVFLTNLYNFAGVYLDPSFFEDAIVVGLQGVEVEPFGPAIRVQLGRAYIASGDLEAAEEQLVIARDMDPKYEDPLIFLSDVYRQQERWEEAKEMLERALALTPDDQALVEALAAVEAELEGE